jgi:hypothetical protein
VSAAVDEDGFAGDGAEGGGGEDLCRNIGSNVLIVVSAVAYINATALNAIT